MNKNIVEEKFEKFIRDNNVILDSKVIDYIGINVMESAYNEKKFKAYLKHNYSVKDNNTLVNWLDEREMIRYISSVQDKNDKRRKRCDIGLKNRSNSNMQDLFKVLSKETILSKSNLEEIIKLSKMKVTNLHDFDYAGLYFLGFVEVEKKIKMVKTHYINRECNNPDVLHKNYKYNDDYFLKYIDTISDCKLKILKPFIKQIINECGANLWMFGVDFSSMNNKYKIYLKNVADVYNVLSKVFDDNRFIYLRKRISDLAVWNEQYTEWYCEGVALGANSRDEYSINFYYKLRVE